MTPKARALQQRTRAFFIRISTFCESLPRTDTARRVIPQLIDAAGSTSSNYNGACRARSRKEFIAKIGVCVEEASESLEWLLSLKDANIGSPQERDELIDEANQLTAIFTASQKTARRRNP
jgi:four helix bundle protein